MFTVREKIEYGCDTKFATAEIITFYYYEWDNVMVDENGEPVYDIFRYVHPNRFLLYKEKQGTYYVPGDGNIIYELVFPLDDENPDDYSILAHYHSEDRYS